MRERCRCWSKDLREIVTASLDVGVGPGLPLESKLVCNKCDSVVDYWCTGHWMSEADRGEARYIRTMRRRRFIRKWKNN